MASLTVENGFTKQELEYLALVEEIDSQRLWMLVAIDEFKEILDRKRRVADPDFDEIFEESLNAKAQDFWKACERYDEAVAKMNARRKA